MILILSNFGELRIPEGWTLELLPRRPAHALLTTSSITGQYMATIDFQARGARSGHRSSGRFISEEWNKPRKKYLGRGWRQELVDDAVAYLRDVVRASGRS